MMPQEHYRDDNIGWGCQKKIKLQRGKCDFLMFLEKPNKQKNSYARQAAFIW